MVILTWSRSHVLAILAAVNGAMTVPQYGYDQAPIWKNKTCFEHGTYGLSKDGSLPKHRDGCHTKWGFGAPKVLENSHSCPPAHAPIFELQHYPCWFSVHLILLFRIWGTCMHPSLPYLCQTLRPTSTTSSIYPSSCWLHRYFCTEKSRVHEILVKSWLRKGFPVLGLW